MLVMMKGSTEGVWLDILPSRRMFVFASPLQPNGRLVPATAREYLVA